MSAQVEACLNSRPLGPLDSHSSEGVSPLTPGHFIIGRPLQAYPELAIDINVSLCRRWVLCQAAVQQFWRRWSIEYLQQLQASRKWKTPQPNLAIGDLVLMTDGNVFQAHWTMAKVIEVYPGDDGLVRAVDLKVCNAVPPNPNKNSKCINPEVKTRVFRRPVTKLVLLLPAEKEQTT